MIHNLILSQMNPRDISNTYAGTYLRFKTPDDDGWYTGYVDQIDRDADETYMKVLKINQDIVWINLEDSRNKICMNFPELGNINHRESSWHVRRAASQQWKKGLRPHLLDTFLHGQEVIDILQPYRAHFSVDAINALYEPKYTDYLQALEEVESGDKVSRAVSKHFAIANHRSIDVPVLVYKTNVVGYYKDNVVNVNECLSFLEPMIRRIVPSGYHSINIRP